MNGEEEEDKWIHQLRQVITSMVRRFTLQLAVVFGLLSFAFMGCSSVPLSGRNRVNVVSDEQILGLSAREYAKFISSAPISRDKAATDRMLRVGRRIASATERYLTNAGMPREAKKFRWEFNLIRDRQVNAWCMPGGKIVVFEGILPLCPTDDDLATVISHEVAHAMAKHANERMSSQVLQNAGGQVLGNILGGALGSVGQVIGGIAYSAGMRYFVDLPYSRQHEFEADKIGLYLMAMAGYDYTKAVGFWKRMAAHSGGGNSGNNMWSTHPSDESRIAAIEAELPNVRAFMASGGRVTKAPVPVPVRNQQTTTSPKQNTTVIPGNAEREVPLKTHY